MDLAFERSYPTPLSNSTLLPLLLLSLARQEYSPNTSTTFKEEYDYIVVGGGAAGSVVASRLSNDTDVSVLLLEAGHEPPRLTEVPALAPYFLGTDIDWQYKTVPQKHAASGLVNRQIAWVAGKLLGGGSNYNEMVYSRGNRKDYDDWALLGAKGWSYKEVKEYFLKLENNTDPAFLANDYYHASGGPITVESSAYYTEIKNALNAAARKLGYKFLDVNAENQTGVFHPIQRNVRDNQRCSSVKGYLVPAGNWTNLDILLNAMVTKVIIDKGQATGIKFYHDGQYRTVKARIEVVLSAGTINTPQLLMLSGIGPREELKKLNIPLTADLPVGMNLQNQPATFYYLSLSNGSQTLDEEISTPSNIRQYIDNRTGPLGDSPYMQAFLNGKTVEPDIDYPTVSIHVTKKPQNYSLKGKNIIQKVYEQFFRPYEGKPYMVCLVIALQTKSFGKVTLNSSNPFDPPLINPKYLEHPGDLENLVEGLKICKRLFSTDPVLELGIRPFTTLVPGCEEYNDSEDDYFRCYAKTLTFGGSHGVGTCKMGNSKDITTVVDPELRVKGIKGLRVVDASVMPVVPSGSTHIPTVMIAEKASEMIKSSRLEQTFQRICKIPLPVLCF